MDFGVHSEVTHDRGWLPRANFRAEKFLFVPRFHCLGKSRCARLAVSGTQRKFGASRPAGIFMASLGELRWFLCSKFSFSGF